MKKQIYLMLICILTLFPLRHPVFADQALNLRAKEAIAVEYSTGKILYQKNSDRKVPIASLTKIMTIYLTLKEINSGRLKWDDSVEMSKYATALANNSDISNPPLYKNSYSVKELVDSSMVVSSNTSAIALAEKISGSEAKFVDKMKDQLKTWGITDYQLVNASGLNNSMLNGHIYPGSSKTSENRLSAKSLAIVSRHLIKDFPEILTISSQNQIYWGNDILTNSNHLLPGNTMARNGVDGLKTGTTTKAGQTYIGTAVQDKMRVIVVILNATDAPKDNNARFVEANKLFDYSFQNYQKITIPKGKPFSTKLSISNAKQKMITFKSNRDFTVIQPINVQTIHYKIVPNKEHTKAPITKGEQLGKIILNDQSNYLGEKPSSPIFATKSINALSIWEKFKSFFTHSN
ncbi:D-alanyl-D-alanine carboxypeptidase PBP3 [Streptococcus pseudoporcinus]|uniref:serine-type D-Ala-D-Ala carboxypeptidase n=1 Tax=Streptococcus pseudoporcinus TaxID=361101 RepID=A0A4U9XI66_9STRE|nr:D-alanyl-D-alanine carboxypeptidase PBP3 [Streptococcus pseudoporcinus]VTS12656.1 D-alanyl-D-alanine carboxypeptidase [Streptococcus pseudoporcinus]VUC65313.1 D-alanyl-D-alanine carboxypeptidase [Streptococcus pseudoporcinus]VUC96153.1 D-alanyl-D-alanine carboxypeptidase [Streptococcus pseudoporcinus]VUC96549.1 D-alanyl-D-alanine carboxypeptidase [Streptococcus pseudoporcinus]